MANFIDLRSADGFVFPAYVAEPAGKPKGAVVVLQEIFAETNAGVLPLQISEHGTQRCAVGCNLTPPGVGIQRARYKHFHRNRLGQFNRFHGVNFRQMLRDARPLFSFIAAHPERAAGGTEI